MFSSLHNFTLSEGLLRPCRKYGQCAIRAVPDMLLERQAMNTKLCLGVALFWCLECQSLAFAKRYDPGVDNDVSATCSAEGFCLTVGYTGKAWKLDEWSVSTRIDSIMSLCYKAARSHIRSNKLTAQCHFNGAIEETNRRAI